jgi:hypothetical protein
MRIFPIGRHKFTHEIRCNECSVRMRKKSLAGLIYWKHSQPDLNLEFVPSNTTRESSEYLKCLQRKQKQDTGKPQLFATSRLWLPDVGLILLPLWQSRTCRKNEVGSHCELQGTLFLFWTLGRLRLRMPTFEINLWREILLICQLKWEGRRKGRK